MSLSQLTGETNNKTTAKNSQRLHLYSLDTQYGGTFIGTSLPGNRVYFSLQLSRFCQGKKSLSHKKSLPYPQSLFLPIALTKRCPPLKQNPCKSYETELGMVITQHLGHLYITVVCIHKELLSKPCAAINVHLFII